MEPWQWPAELSLWITRLAEPLHGRLRHRLTRALLGLLLAQGRRTVASWLRAAEVGQAFRRYYYFLGSLGRKAPEIAGRLLRVVQERLGPCERFQFALDDTPTKRFGPKVQGAGIHHNPTSGPAKQKFLYGHVWVTLSWIARHRSWGTIALPLLARLYVRAKDVPRIPTGGWRFQTKLDQAAELVEWVCRWLRSVSRPIWIVTDGAYAKRPFLKRALAAGAVVVSRLRKDAALWNLPGPSGGRRGRPRKYGRARISLAKRAGQTRGWQNIECEQYGRRVTKSVKTFLATYRPAGGLIRVVLVQEQTAAIAFFCTDPQANVPDILEVVADRAAIEQDFHDLKEVHGAGQQQVRRVWASIAAWHLNLWMHTLIELWAWDSPRHRLSDRKRSPWDDPDRRPSHADRRAALRRQCLTGSFSRITPRRPVPRKLKRILQRLVALVA